MSDEERQLTELLHRAVPEPPHSIDLSRITPSRVRRPRTTWLPAIAAASVVVLLLVAGYLISRPEKRIYSPGRPSQRSAASKPTATSSSTPALAWPTQQLAVTDQPAPVVALGAYLYRQDPTGFSRIDAESGQAVAGYHHQIAWPPVFANGQVWAAVPVSSGYQLEELTAASLRESSGFGGADSTNPTAGAQPVLAASPDGTTVALGIRSMVYLFDAVRGESSSATTIGGTVTAMTFSPDGSKLFVAHRDRVVKLATVRVSPLQLVDDRPNPDGNLITALAATAGGLWVSERAGMAASLDFAPGFDLARARPVAAAGGGVAPVITVSPSTVWLAGKTEIACADPQTGSIRSRTPLLDNAVITSIAPISGRLAVGLQDSAYRISYLTPPSSCG